MDGAVKFYGIATFIALVTIFSISQVFRGVMTGRITSPSTLLPTRNRTQHPIRFWMSMTYYVVWILGAVYAVVTYFVTGGRLPSH